MCSKRLVAGVAQAAEDLHGTVGGLADRAVGAVVGHRDLVADRDLRPPRRAALVEARRGLADQRPEHGGLGVQRSGWCPTRTSRGSGSRRRHHPTHDDDVRAAVRSGTLTRLAVANPRYPFTRDP
jgi:hypothetical protein